MVNYQKADGISLIIEEYITRKYRRLY